MIDAAINIVKQELNQYLVQFATDPTPEKVLLTDLNDEGAALSDKIGMTLISLEEERAHKSQSPYFVNDAGVTEKRNPDIKLNLYIMFSAFSNPDVSGGYAEALKQLARVITFFQGKNVFSHENTPELDVSIEKLFLDMHNLTTEQQNDLWGKFTVKYKPSVCYKIRMLTIQRNNVTEQRPLIDQITAGVNRKD